MKMMKTTSVVSCVQAIAATALLVCFLASEASAADRLVPTDFVDLGAAMGGAAAGDVIIIETDGPHILTATVNWRQPITVRPKDATVNPVIKSTWTEFLQPFGPDPNAMPPSPGAQGTKFGDNNFGTITLDAGGNRDGVGEADPARPGPMWHLIDLQHAPGAPIVFENVHIINPGSNENTSGPGIRAIITQHNAESGASYTFDNCTVDFRGADTNNILADQDSENINLIDCTFLADGEPTFPVIRLDGRTEGKPMAMPPELPRDLDMNLLIQNCHFEGPLQVIDLMQGNLTVTVDNSTLRTPSGQVIRVQSLVAGANVEVKGDSTLVRTSDVTFDLNTSAILFDGLVAQTLDIDDSRIGGPNDVIELSRGFLTLTVDNSCLTSVGDTGNSAVIRASFAVDSTDVDVNDSILVTNGDNDAAVLFQGSKPHDLTMDHCDVQAAKINGEGIRFGIDGTANVTNSIVSVGTSGIGFAANPATLGTLDADYNNVFTNGGTDYEEPQWTVTNPVAAGDPLYTDINNCDASYANGALFTADSAGGPLGSDGTGTPVLGLQLPGNCNQDNSFDLSDAIHFLGFLFQGSASLPCSTEAANLALMDVNDDQGLDLSDAVYILAFLFQGGPEPEQGRVCISIPNCPDNPACP